MSEITPEYLAKLQRIKPKYNLVTEEYIPKDMVEMLPKEVLERLQVEHACKLLAEQGRDKRWVQRWKKLQENTLKKKHQNEIDDYIKSKGMRVVHDAEIEELTSKTFSLDC